jgi:glycosyltransferase involved in cell wall biosynthesis
MPSCVIIVENLPVPLDRRVWQEATALRDAGWTVSVICPATAKYPKHRERIDEIEIFRHSLPLEASGVQGYFVEYIGALFHEFRLLFAVHRAVGFDVIQACNPPDLIFLAALHWKLLGKKFVYDHHDVCPELLVAKFGNRPFLKAAALLAERFAFKVADLVVSANDTFRLLALDRGGRRPEDVITVYSIPDRRFFSRVGSVTPRTNGASIVIGYVGVVGTHDGVENMALMAKHLIVDHGIRNFVCVIVGDGPGLSTVRAMVNELDLSEYFKFTGYLTGADFLGALSSFEIGIIPDPVNSFNDKITMNKAFEYSALGLPIVAFNLSETRRVLGDAAIFAASDDAGALAKEVARLIGDPGLRQELGQRAKALADASFDWSKEAQKYVSALTALCKGRQ